MAIASNMYYVIANRMLEDPGFMDYLEEDPAGAIQATLSATDIDISPEDLDTLVEEYDSWAKDNLAKVKKGYKKQVAPMVM
jgi:hypothetical protein